MGFIDDACSIISAAQKIHKAIHAAEEMGWFDDSNNNNNFAKPENNNKELPLLQDSKFPTWDYSIIESGVINNVYIYPGKFVNEGDLLLEINENGSILPYYCNRTGIVASVYITTGMFVNSGSPTFKFKEVEERSLLFWVKSPMSGTITDIYVNYGPITPSQPIAVINSNGRSFYITSGFSFDVCIKGNLINCGEYVDANEAITAVFFDEEDIDDLIANGYVTESYCPSPYSGTVTKIYVGCGDWVDKGDYLIQVDVNGRLFDLQSSISGHIGKVYVCRSNYLQAGDTFLSYLVEVGNE